MGGSTCRSKRGDFAEVIVERLLLPIILSAPRPKIHLPAARPILN